MMLKPHFSLSLTEIPLDRDSWTETSPDRDSPGQRVPDRVPQKEHGIRDRDIPVEKTWDQAGSDIIQRPLPPHPCGQNDRHL